MRQQGWFFVLKGPSPHVAKADAASLGKGQVDSLGVVLSGNRAPVTKFRGTWRVGAAWGRATHCPVAGRQAGAL